MIRAVVCIPLLIGLGCSGKLVPLKETDLVWQDMILVGTVEQVFQNIQNGFRLCNAGVPVGRFSREGKTGHLDIYQPQKFGGGPGTRILGVIDLEQKTSDATAIKFGVFEYYDYRLRGGEGVHRKRWSRWAAGNLACS